MEAAAPPPTFCIVEPYCSGSHARLVDFLRACFPPPAPPPTVLTLPGKKWHWRLQAGSLWAAQRIPALAPGATLLVTSMLNLCELLGLRPDLAAARTVLYMHENQLAYPWRSAAEGEAGEEGGGGGGGGGAREFHAGWAQLTSLLSARAVCWNSMHNLDSFAAALPGLLRSVPDRAQRPSAAALAAAIYARSVVLHCPVPRPQAPPRPRPRAPPVLRVAWPHRWEHDKRPEALFQALLAPGVHCQLVLLGEAYAQAPACFEAARPALDAAGRIAHWGYAPSPAAYGALLASCDAVLSTAAHEFFGVAVVEGVLAGALPLCPRALAYPEVLAPGARARAAAAASPARLRQLLGGGGGGGGGGMLLLAGGASGAGEGAAGSAVPVQEGVGVAGGSGADSAAAAAASSGDFAWAPPASIKFTGQGSGDARGGGGGAAPRKRPHGARGGEGGEGGEDSGGGDCAYFYSGGAEGLAEALRGLQENLGLVRAWRGALGAALGGGAGGGSSEAAGSELEEEGGPEEGGTGAGAGAGGGGGGGGSSEARKRAQRLAALLTEDSARALAARVLRYTPEEALAGGGWAALWQ